jgi:hypothetical protein
MAATNLIVDVYDAEPHAGVTIRMLKFVWAENLRDLAISNRSERLVGSRPQRALAQKGGR